MPTVALFSPGRVRDRCTLDRRGHAARLALILAAVFAASCRPQEERQPVSPRTISVSLAVDPVDGGEAKQCRLSLPGRATVFDALCQAESDGFLTFTHRGSGTQCFVLSINDVANRGAGGPNWVYRVNGELGDRSCAVFKLNDGDAIIWRFGSYP